MVNQRNTASGAAETEAAPAIDANLFYLALTARDARFDGRFFTAVRTTGIYCRPICPARTPMRKNVEFYLCPAAAESAGFRPCMRCRPDAAPGSPEWRGTGTTVARALRLIGDGALDEGGVTALAERLGVGERHLHRLFLRHLGASPVAVGQSRRAHLARQLLDTSTLTITEVAFASGFRSLRRFNDVFRKTFDRSPREFRDRAPGGNVGTRRNMGTRLRLPYRAPFDWPALLAFLGPRCLPGLENVENESFSRLVRTPDGSARITVSWSDRDGALEVATDLPPTLPLLQWIGRVQDLFDTQTDVAAVEEHLRGTPHSERFRFGRGVRVPGAWNGFELAVRAVLGQQVTVVGATTLAGRLIELCGGLDPEVMMETELARIGMPGKRAQTLQDLARAQAEGRLCLEPWADPVEARARLAEIPGIGPWTVEYVAMRALRDPDAFPASDLGLRKALGNGGPCSAKEAEARAEAWRPWRSYAAQHLWLSLSDAPANPVRRSSRGGNHVHS